MQYTAQQHKTLRHKVVEDFFTLLNTEDYYNGLSCLETPLTISGHEGNKTLWNFDDIHRYFGRMCSYLKHHKIILQTVFIKEEQFDESFVLHQEEAHYYWTEPEAMVLLGRARFVLLLRYNGRAWHVNHILDYCTDICFDSTPKAPAMPKPSACNFTRRSRLEVDS